METMQPALKNGRNVWDQINMAKVEFQERIKKIKKEMKKGGIDVLLVYSNANEYGSPCYLSNFIVGHPRGALVVIPKRDEIALIYEGPTRGIPSAKTTTWVEEVRASGDVSKECVRYLKEKDFIPSTIGFVGLRQLMPSYQLQFLFESLNQSKIVDSDDILREMRMVKSERECNQVRRSCRILTRAFDFISDTSFPNMNEKILEAMVNKETRLEGVEDFRMLIAKPMETKWAFRPVEEVQISSGDSVIIYLAVESERYWSEGIRTFIMRDSSFIEVKPEGVIALYDQMMDGLKPGKKVSQFYKETIGKIRKSNANAIREYGLGQGIGLSLQEFPVITEEDESLLKEGMCLTLRLAIQDKELGAVMVGDTIHVSKNGPEVLTR